MRPQRRQRIIHAFWRIVNPPTRPLAGVVPWWVLLETTGAKTARKRRVPLAAGPREPNGMWLNAVHGRHCGWVRNIESDPNVRLRFARRWRDGVASIHPPDEAVAARFNAYARSGPRAFGIDPLLVFVEWVDD
jgi:deazaflavin-dependent oxidoreductase (nitroreductase family)